MNHALLLSPSHWVGKSTTNASFGKGGGGMTVAIQMGGGEGAQLADTGAGSVAERPPDEASPAVGAPGR